MPIRLDYTPVVDLLGLAKAAGMGAGAERREAGDLAFTGMILQQQARYADIAGRLQAQDRAFSLQEAAVSRIAGTPTAAGARPAVTDNVLARMQYTQGIREQQQQGQLTQLERMRDMGEIDAGEFERLKLNLLTRRTTAPQLEDQIRPRISSANELRLIRDTFKRERSLHTNTRRFLQEWLAAPKGLTPEQRTAYRTQLDEINAALTDVDSREAAAVDEFRRDGAQPQVVDPITGQAAAGIDPYEGVQGIGPSGERIIRRNGQWVSLK